VVGSGQEACCRVPGAVRLTRAGPLVLGWLSW